MFKHHSLDYEEFAFEQLSAEDKSLVLEAKAASQNAYTPYSHFDVGCAIRLADHTIVRGNNQENASYPCGLCAERTTLFWANANYPTQAPVALAIAAQTNGQFSKNPLPPCGACRQALLETEQRFKQPIRIILYGTSRTLVVPNAATLLPFQFNSSFLG